MWFNSHCEMWLKCVEIFISFSKRVQHAKLNISNGKWEESRIKLLEWVWDVSWNLTLFKSDKKTVHKQMNEKAFLWFTSLFLSAASKHDEESEIASCPWYKTSSRHPGYEIQLLFETVVLTMFVVMKPEYFKALTGFPVVLFIATAKIKMNFLSKEQTLKKHFSLIGVVQISYNVWRRIVMKETSRVSFHLNLS